MRNRLLVLPVTAGLLVVTAVTTAAARPARDTAGPGVPAVAAPDPARAVVLINGDRIMTAPWTGRQSVTALPAGSGMGGSLLTLGAGGVRYEIPVAAVPFLGNGLDPGLFNVGDLLRGERSGRVPVRVAYRGRRPVLPGVTLTRAGGGAAAGYLTASSARVFGAALARQFSADRSRGSYGRDGMFTGGVSVGLAGTAPARGRRSFTLVRATRPRFVMHTLTVTGTDLAGRPDTGGFLMVVNVDDSRRFFDGATFDHGTVKLSVPAGHYWAAGIFTDAAQKGTPPAQRMVVLPQFTVARDSAVRVDERTATSKITVSTPKPSRALDTNVNVLRQGAAGPASYADISGQGRAPAEPMMTLGYQVAGLGLDGSVAAGRQSIGITVGHLPLAAAARITTAAARVSFDGGRTWHAATVTGAAGAYRAAFTAPAATYVTLRVTAADAAGGRIAETITSAYKIAP